MQRRQALLGATAVVSSLAGCVDSFISDGSLREVRIELRNTQDRAQTFHIALETESSLLDWESHHVDTGVNEQATITPDEDASPVALHGAVEDFAGSVEILGVSDLDNDYCLQFHFWCTHPTDDRPQIAQVADTEC